MSGINAKAVRIGLADQSSTVGALSRGAVITTIPTDFDAAATAITGFSSSGYISSEGASVNTTLSVTDIREMNTNAVRRLLEQFDGTLSLTLIQLDEESAKQCFGADNVTVTAATSTKGKRMKIAIGASLPEPQAWALRMKDGDARMLVLIPNGQVTSGVEITFVANDAIKLPVTISANDDGTGHSMYIFTDDGIRVHGIHCRQHRHHHHHHRRRHCPYRCQRSRCTVDDAASHFDLCVLPE